MLKKSLQILLGKRLQVSYQELKPFIDAKIAYHKASKQLEKLKIYLAGKVYESGTKGVEEKLNDEREKNKYITIMQDYESKYSKNEEININKLNKLVNSLNKKDSLPDWVSQEILINFSKVNEKFFRILTSDEKCMQRLVGSTLGEENAFRTFIVEAKAQSENYDNLKALSNIEAYQTQAKISGLLFAMTKVDNILKKSKQPLATKQPLLDAISQVEQQWVLLLAAKKQVQEAYINNSVYSLNSPDPKEIKNFQDAIDNAEKKFQEVRKKYESALGNLSEVAQNTNFSTGRLRSFTNLFTRSDNQKLPQYVQNVQRIAKQYLDSIREEKNMDNKEELRP